uniref:Uncharacterized protein n=1 Tax=Arundo donax TaxID=35708 RepID=A0A0A9G3M1_ARUDO
MIHGISLVQTVTYVVSRCRPRDLICNPNNVRRDVGDTRTLDAVLFSYLEYQLLALVTQSAPSIKTTV